MNVASLELCKELYELSGWAGSRHRMDGGVEYDLGYLLRKLPNDTSINKLESSIFASIQDGVGAEAATPEDAVAKLAIELFKQGVLK